MNSIESSIQSKLPKAGTTIFSIMSGLANETGAINLSQGFPGFPVSEELISLYHQAMKDGHNQYAPMPGIISLREHISEKIHEMYGHIYNPDSEITITAGGTQALNTAIIALIHPGDEVIVPEPAYDSYIPSVLLAGGIPVPIALKAPDYKINWDTVRSKVSPRTRMIIINTPQNPSGSIIQSDDMKELENLVRDTNILVLSDEVYEHIIFDEEKHESVSRYPGLAERSLIVYSFGKTYHATGWKTGYIVGPAYLMREFRRVHQFTVFSVNTPLQFALAEYMKNKNNYLGIPAFYQRKRDLFQSLMKDSAFKILPCKGSYFQLLDYSAISDEKDTDYAVRLTRENGVASIPVSVFYTEPNHNKLLRFCFAKEDVMLEAAAAKLRQIKVK